jgi:hypothetical protein
MNHYEPSIPRASLGILAVVVSAIALSLTVLAPALMEPGGQELGLSAEAKTLSQPPVEVVILPPRVDVIAVRSKELASAQVRAVDPKCKQDI